MTLEARPQRCVRCQSQLEDTDQGRWCASCLWQGLFAEEDGEARAGERSGGLFSFAGHVALEEIGRGGGGVVYRARQESPPREVAVKMLHPQQLASEEKLDRFRREVLAISTLDHPAILPVYSVGEYSGMPYFTMKLATGGSLAREVRNGGRDYKLLARRLQAAAEAVHFAHTRGVIHRDLKPANILFGEAGQVYVSDFGLARFVESDCRVTVTAASYGTPAYLAPEVAERGVGAATTATDVYGLGAILYEGLTGQPPFTEPSLPALTRSIVEALPVAPRALQPTAPRDLEAIALRCLEKAPADRPATAAEVAADLRRWLEGKPVLARRVATWERVVHWAKINPALALLSLAFVGGAALGTAALLRQNQELRSATVRARDAELAMRKQLQGALINEARIKRRSGQVGQRTEALALLDRAAALGFAPSLRSEYIAALVQPDLQILQRLPAARARSDTTLDLSPSLDAYLEEGDDGFVERTVLTQAVRRSYRGTRAEPWYLSYEAGGRTLMAQYRNGTSELWDREAGVCWWQGGTLYGTDAQPQPLAVSPDGNEAAWVQLDHSVVRIRRGEASRSTWAKPAGEVRSLVFNARGDRLVVVRRDEVELFRWPEGERLWRKQERMGPARPAWSPDGQRIALGVQGDQDIVIVAAATGKEERRLAAHGNEVRLLQFHPQGRWLASVGWDAVLRVHDVLGGERLLEREAWVRTLRFSADGRRMAFSVNQAETGIAELPGSAALSELGAEPVTSDVGCRLEVSTDGRWVMSADFSELRIWEASSGYLAARTAAPVTMRATAERDWPNLLRGRGAHELWESRRFTGLFRYRWEQTVQENGVSTLRWEREPLAGPPGDLVARDAESGDCWVVSFGAGTLQRWPGGRASEAHTLAQHPGLDGAQLSPDGRNLLFRLYPEPGVRVIDAMEGAAKQLLPSGRTLSASFTPQGDKVVTGTESAYTVWRLSDGVAVASWPAQTEGGSYGGVRFSRDGRWVAVLQRRGTLEVRQTDNWEQVVELELPQSHWINDFQWSSEGDSLYLLCLGHRVFRWDLQAVRRELANRNLDWR